MTRFAHPRVLALPAVVVVAWAVLAFVPARAEQADALDRVETARNERLAAAGELVEVLAFVDERAILEDRFVQLERALPAESELGSFTRDVERMARSASVSVEVISPSSGGEGEDLDLPAGLALVSVSITAVGEYGSLVDFIEQVELGERLVVIDAISMTTDASDPSLLSVDLGLQIFTTTPVLSSDDSTFDDEEFFDE